MQSLPTEVESALGRLVETCCDAEAGFKLAADKIDDPALQSKMIKFANHHQAFARQLKTEMTRLGISHPDGGTLKGAAHRGWMTVRAALTSDSPGKILEECCRGEKAALEQYDEALGVQLPTQTRALVQDQRRHIQAALDVIDLQESLTNPSGQ